MKSYTKTEIGSGIAIRKIADLIREKEKQRTPNFFVLFFSAWKTRRDEPRATGSSSAAAAAPAARTDRGGADGLGRLGAALFKGCPRAVSRSGTAQSRFVFLIIPLGRKIKIYNKRTPKILK